MSTAVCVTVPVSRTKEIGSEPMFFAGGGGQSWLVGKSPSIALSPFVHASPSFGPAPWLAFVPPTQLPV